MDDAVIKDVVRQHLNARQVFKEEYSFTTKQNNIVFNLEQPLIKYMSEQIADQKKVEILNKKISERQHIINILSDKLQITKTVSEADVGDEN